MISNDNISIVLNILKDYIKQFKEPIVTRISRKKEPFKVLMGTVLSARTKDEVTKKAFERLMEKADTPEKILELDNIEELIYPVGFYKTKAKNIKILCNQLIEEFNGNVPDTLEDLLKLKGVGRKTANLVLVLGFDKYGVCVDTHVHRISNRWKYVSTKTPEETEFALRKKLPKRYWKEYNDILVTFGQNLCKPVKPLCEKCPIIEYCSYFNEKLI
ncbi:MAG: endonuclease III, partial [Methanomicrobia archaeon]|nr:endonuclease III [Methanomicrobia archaeon]